MHLTKSFEIKGMPVGIHEMRRHLTNYFKGLPHFKETRLKLVTSLDVEEIHSILDDIAVKYDGFKQDPDLEDSSEPVTKTNIQ